MPSRPPPPGFSSHDRDDQAFDVMSGELFCFPLLSFFLYFFLSLSSSSFLYDYVVAVKNCACLFLFTGNHLLETSSLLRNPYQASPTSGNISGASDIELIDPAILAVGKGRLPSGVNNSGMDVRTNFHAHTPLFENDSRLQLLMQRSLSPHQNLRYSEVGNNFTVRDAYGLTSRHVDQSQPGNASLFEQFSLQKARNTAATSGHWDGWSEVQTGNDIGIAEFLRNERLGFNKFGMTSSGDLYNRSFRM